MRFDPRIDTQVCDQVFNSATGLAQCDLMLSVVYEVRWQAYTHMLDPIMSQITDQIRTHSYHQLEDHMHDA